MDITDRYTRSLLRTEEAERRSEVDRVNPSLRHLLIIAQSFSVADYLG